MILPQAFYVRNFATYLFVVLMLSSLLACNTRYGFRNKIKINAKEETRVNKPLKMPTVLMLSEPINIEGEIKLETPKIFEEDLDVEETKKTSFIAKREFKIDTHAKKNHNTIFRKASSPQKANPWFAGFVIAMVVGLIALILFAPPAILISFLVILLFAFILLRIIGKSSKSTDEMKLGKEGREASKQARRHKAVVLLMSLSIIFLLLGSIFFYPLIVPLLLCIPLLIVSFLALKNESAKGRRMLYLLGILFGLFLTIFFTAALISFSPPG